MSSPFDKYFLLTYTETTVLNGYLIRSKVLADNRQPAGERPGGRENWNER
jgi:hypothetical protein